MSGKNFEVTFNGKNILCFAGDYVEDYEIMVPFQALQLCGHKVTVVCPEKKTGDTVRTSVHYFDGAQTFREDRGHDFELNGTFDDINAEEFDALVVPGGRAPEYLRMNKKVVEVTTRFLTTGKPVAAICHGPLILAATGKLKGYELTAYPTIEPDLTAAGGTWKGGDVWSHKNLVTASAWPAHPEWLAAFLELLNTKIVNE